MTPIEPFTFASLTFALGLGFGALIPALFRRVVVTPPAAPPVEVKPPKLHNDDWTDSRELTDFTRFIPPAAALPSLMSDENEDAGDETPSVSLVSYIDELESAKDSRREPLRVSIAGRTDIGKRRQRNEDRYLVLHDEAMHRRLFAVIDGMGSGGGGGFASRLAAEVISARFGSPGLHGSSSAQRPSLANALVWSIEEANRAIFETGKETPQLDGMGATIVGAIYDEPTRSMCIAHVGDSRAYRLRRGQCELLTVDHTVAPEGPMAVYLRRALGVRRQVKIDLAVGAAEPGDVYLLCSDGLSSMRTDQEIARLLADADSPEAAVEMLIAEANAAGGKDNIAVVVVRLDDAQRVRDPHTEPHFESKKSAGAT